MPKVAFKTWLHGLALYKTIRFICIFYSTTKWYVATTPLFYPLLLLDGLQYGRFWSNISQKFYLWETWPTFKKLWKNWPVKQKLKVVLPSGSLLFCELFPEGTCTTRHSQSLIISKEYAMFEYKTECCSFSTLAVRNKLHWSMVKINLQQV